VIGDGGLDTSVMIAGKTDGMNNSRSANHYQEKITREILKSVKILCIKCHGKMIRVRDLYDDTLVGYSCQDCPHYNLLDDNPV